LSAGATNYDVHACGVRSTPSIEDPIPQHDVVTRLGAGRDGETSLAERLVHVLAEPRAVLETLEVDHPIDVVAKISDDVLLEHLQRGIRRWVARTQHDLQTGIGNVGICAGGSHMVL
jgi:hypothetical protein